MIYRKDIEQAVAIFEAAGLQLPANSTLDGISITWHSVLANYNGALFEDACKSLLAKSKFFPKLSDVVDEMELLVDQSVDRVTVQEAVTRVIPVMLYRTISWVTYVRNPDGELVSDKPHPDGDLSFLSECEAKYAISRADEAKKMSDTELQYLRNDLLKAFTAIREKERCMYIDKKLSSNYVSKNKVCNITNVLKLSLAEQ
jgi:hypothetical protein